VKQFRLHRRIGFIGGRRCHFCSITQLALVNENAKLFLDLADERDFRLLACVDLAAGLEENLAAALAYEKETARLIADDGC